MKKISNKKLINEWFALAGDDELSGEAILKEQAAPRTLCFLSEQMAEKYLKAMLVFFGVKIEKTHDLMRLTDLISLKLSGIEKYRRDLAFLNRFYIGTRYPGGVEGFSWPEAEKAFGIAKSVKNFVFKVVGL